MYWVRLGFARLALLRVAVLAACWSLSATPVWAQEPKLVEVARGLDRPWAVAPLPDGRFLITERAGSMRIVQPDGQVSPPLSGVPTVLAAGQGGLLDLILSPRFGQDRTVFFAFSQPSSNGSRTSVASARLGADGLADVRIIFAQTPLIDGAFHFGARLVFDRGGNLFITLGDRWNGAPQAQDPANHLGKVVRIKPDGSVPDDNPYRNTPGARPEIWSIGHRNVQGAVIDPRDGRLWTHEHGAQGGDELNLTLPGKNYGWPVITWGRAYNGDRIGEGTSKPGLEQPVKYWDPSIAPSGMLFYSGDRFPAWRNSILIGSLKFRHLVRVQLDGDKVVAEEKLLEKLNERIRDVRQGPDGHIYVLTDSSEGKLIRLEP